MHYDQADIAPSNTVSHPVETSGPTAIAYCDGIDLPTALTEEGSL